MKLKSFNHFSVGGDMDSYPIIAIEGIGPVYREKLRAVGIRSTMQLLKHSRTPKSRSKLVAESGIGHKLILEWANHADLMRIKGIGGQYSDLLEATGVDTVKELAKRNGQNIHSAILKVNEKKRLVRRPPALGEVKRWVERAKKLRPMLEY
jgi:predicted flap endonuclease-1-like 5' DNA nuclease